jgi:hypothetical protein
MPTFVFTYRLTPGYTRTPESGAAWTAWFDGMGSQVAELGQPAVSGTAIGNCGPGTELSGYSLISADDLDSALEVAKGCPSLTRGGGVEIAQLVEVPAAARETADAVRTGDQAS